MLLLVTFPHGGRDHPRRVTQPTRLHARQLLRYLEPAAQHDAAWTRARSGDGLCRRPAVHRRPTLHSPEPAYLDPARHRQRITGTPAVYLPGRAIGRAVSRR